MMNELNWMGNGGVRWKLVSFGFFFKLILIFIHKIFIGDILVNKY